MNYIKEDSLVLVTGADGFIGSHLVEALVRRGFKVRHLYITTRLIHGDGWMNVQMMLKESLKCFREILGIHME